MWSARLEETRRRKWTARMGGAAVGLALALSGCAPGYVTNSSAPVIMTIVAINGGAALLSDVRGEGGTIINCDTDVNVEVTTKNPRDSGTPAENVTISRYEVRFRRSDGRATEGLDVPYAVSGNLSFQVASNGSGVLPVRIVRHAAKIVPPLSNIGGLEIVTMFADVTLYGETVAGQGVSATGSVQIDFADYADGTTTCET